ncbi:Hypothetical_protein [Hexamita inflata]|uniref:Hypothetical_protein n=1 Tax=Hexamita inflata TaxID=28002 RepID=A0ABP1GX00_9EUKA
MERVWLPRVDKSILSIQMNIDGQQHSILKSEFRTCAKWNKVPKICLNWNIRSRSTGQRTLLWFILFDFVNRVSCLNYLNLVVPSSAHKYLQSTNPSLATQKRDQKRVSMAQLVSKDC